MNKLLRILALALCIVVAGCGESEELRAYVDNLDSQCPMPMGFGVEARGVDYAHGTVTIHVDLGENISAEDINAEADQFRDLFRSGASKSHDVDSLLTLCEDHGDKLVFLFTDAEGNAAKVKI